MSELLPCPFCGGTNCAMIEHPESVYDFLVTCDDCNAGGPIAGFGYPAGYQTKELAQAKAIELWNRRAVTLPARLFGLPIVEVDDLGDASDIVIEEWPDTLHVKFTKAETAYTTINDQVFVPLTPKVQRLA